jgi:cell division protein ZapA (FtsZ GTPase activity inhibitor)
MKSEQLEFNVLGTKVKFQQQADVNNSSEKVVNLVLERMDTLRKKNPSLSDKDIVVLTALGFAHEKVELGDEYKSSINLLEESLEKALNFIETNSVQ